MSFVSLKGICKVLQTVLRVQTLYQTSMLLQELHEGIYTDSETQLSKKTKQYIYFFNKSITALCKINRKLTVNIKYQRVDTKRT